MTWSATVFLSAVGIACLALFACERRGAVPTASVSGAPPVDWAKVGSPAEVSKWRYSRTAEADLNGDGNPEQVVLTADVQLTRTGEPLWEDGHRWAVFVADQPQVTLLYAAFVPNGHVEAALLTPDAQGRRHVLIRERTPSQSRSFVVSYEKPGSASAESEASYQLEQWVPDLVNR